MIKYSKLIDLVEDHNKEVSANWQLIYDRGKISIIVSGFYLTEIVPVTTKSMRILKAKLRTAENKVNGVS